MEATVHGTHAKDLPQSHFGSVVNLYKNLGETPRERLERLRGQNPHYTHEVLSYAGRLDPMAEGVLLCLVGSANKRRDTYLEMSKEYTLDVLFGFSTDTYDILGKIMETGDPSVLMRERVAEVLRKFKGDIDQEYPPFSSQPVEGKPLFEWARGNALASLVLPRRTVTVDEVVLESMYKVKESTLFSYIEESVNKVKGDFRQEDILHIWRRHLQPKGARSFPCATVRIACSSGTYVRSIANGLGLELGVPALALHILRTKVGDYTVEKAMH